MEKLEDALSTIADLKKQIEMETVQCKANMTIIEFKHNATVFDMNKTHAFNILKLKTMQRAKISNLKVKHQAETSILNDTISNLNVKHQAEISILNDTISNLKDKHNTTISNLKNQYNATISDLNNKLVSN